MIPPLSFSSAAGTLSGQVNTGVFKEGDRLWWQLALSLPGEPAGALTLAHIDLPGVRSWKQLAGKVADLRHPSGFDLEDGEAIPTTGMGQLTWRDHVSLVIVERLELHPFPNDALQLRLRLNVKERGDAWTMTVEGTASFHSIRVEAGNKGREAADKLLKLDDFTWETEAGRPVLKALLP